MADLEAILATVRDRIARYQGQGIGEQVERVAGQPIARAQHQVLGEGNIARRVARQQHGAIGERLGGSQGPGQQQLVVAHLKEAAIPHGERGPAPAGRPCHRRDRQPQQR